MNIDDLFEKYEDTYDEPSYYIDEDCTQSFTGHIEDYDRGYLSMECDVLDGYLDGVRKDYFFMSDRLETISQVKHNLTNGLSIEFYETGVIHYISFDYHNVLLDFYEYTETGTLKKVDLFTGDNRFGCYIDENCVRRLMELRAEYDLEKMNEEILRDGINFDYKKYFRK